MNKILAAWEWNGPVSEPTAYGEGHINQTYAVTEQTTQKRYILQKINTDTFKDPDGLMENICGVTDFLREKAKQRGAIFSSCGRAIMLPSPIWTIKSDA